MYPSHVEAIISHYHYFPRKYTSDTHAYLCTCHNCMMKGQIEIIQAIRDRYGVDSIKGGVSNDGKYTFHTINWLGYCVNDAPSMMIKRKGGEFVEVLTGLTGDTIADRLNILRKRFYKWPENKIQELSMSSVFDCYSFLNTKIAEESAIKKAGSVDFYSKS